MKAVPLSLRLERLKRLLLGMGALVESQLADAALAAYVAECGSVRMDCRDRGAAGSHDSADSRTSGGATEDPGSREYHPQEDDASMTEPTPSAAERLLDQAIELTFPASDPIAVDSAFRSARRRDRIRADGSAPPAQSGRAKTSVRTPISTGRR